MATPSRPDAARAADAVHVNFGRRRQVEVDHVRHVVDVEAARGHVGGHQDVGLLAAKQLHHAVALLLHHPAVQRLSAVAVRVEVVGELVHIQPRAAEDDRRLGAFEIEDAAKRVHLLRPADDVGHLAHARHLAGRDLLLRDRDTLGILQVPARNGGDPRRKAWRQKARSAASPVFP